MTPPSKVPNSPICSSPESIDAGFYDGPADTGLHHQHQHHAQQIPQQQQQQQQQQIYSTQTQLTPGGGQYEVKFNTATQQIVDDQDPTAYTFNNAHGLEESLSLSDLDQLTGLLPLDSAFVDWNSIETNNNNTNSLDLPTSEAVSFNNQWSNNNNNSLMTGTGGNATNSYYELSSLSPCTSSLHHLPPAVVTSQRVVHGGQNVVEDEQIFLSDYELSEAVDRSLAPLVN